MDTNKKIIKDEIDLNSLLAVLFQNLNLLISLFSVSFFVLLVIYFSSTKLYQSDSLIEVKSESTSNYLPESLSTGLPSVISSQESLTAEIEIYKSEDTIFDALNLLQDSKIIPEEDIPSLDYQGKPRIFKSDISSPTGYLIAGEFNLQAEDIVFIGTAGITSWSRFINQVLPFTDFINSAENTDLITN